MSIARSLRILGYSGLGGYVTVFQGFGLLKMPIFRLEEHELRILFVHIPKNGGGSVEHFFRAHGFNVDLFSIDPSFISCFKCSPQHMHASMLSSLLNLENFDYIFTIFRNPLDRVLSEYKWRIQHPWSGHGFDSWYLKVRSERRRNPYLFDNHLRPQIEFLLPKIKIFAFDLGFSAILDEVAKDIGLQVDLGKVVNQKLGRRLHQIRHDPRLLCLYQNASISTQIRQLILSDYEQDIQIFSRVVGGIHGSLQYELNCLGD